MILATCENCAALTEQVRRLEAKATRATAAMEHEKLRADKLAKNLSYMMGGPGESPVESPVIDDDEEEGENVTMLAPRKNLIPIPRDA